MMFSLRLARLIGRQMAREAFKRDLGGAPTEKDDGGPNEEALVAITKQHG